MSSINSTVSQTHEVCNILGTYQLRDEYFTAAVYRNLIVICAINGLSFPFTTLLNAVFILCILLKPNLRRKKSTVLIGYLAVTDLLVGVTVQPKFLVSVLCRMTGRCSSCPVDTVRVYLLRVSCGSSLVHVTLIAWERYIPIKQALQYKLVVTTKRLLAGMIAAWLVSVALICIPFFHVTLSILFYAIEVLISLTAIVHFYIVIYLESMCHCREIKACNPLPQTNRSRKNEFKAAKTTAVIFCCLLIWYGPSFVAIIISKSIFPVKRSNASIWNCIYPWIPTVIMLNSLCNPLIYGWRVKEFRNLIASIFQIFKCWSSNNSQQPEIEMIEIVELNLNRRLTNGSLANRHKSRWNISINTSCEGSEQHKCRCEAAIPWYVGFWANYSELSDLSSEASSRNKEQNRITVTAIVHMQPKPNLRQPEVLNEDVNSLSAAITKNVPGEAKTTQTATFQEDIEKPREAVAEFEQRITRQEMDDKFPSLAAVMTNLKKRTTKPFGCNSRTTYWGRANRQLWIMHLSMLSPRGADPGQMWGIRPLLPSPPREFD